MSSEYGQTIERFELGDKLQWRTRVRSRSRQKGKQDRRETMRADTRSVRSKEHGNQWVVKVREGEQHPPRRILQCGEGVRRNKGNEVEYLGVRDGATPSIRSQPALECSPKAVIETKTKVWIDPLKNKVFPEKRLGEKLETRRITLGDGTTYAVTFRELELFLMKEENREALTQFKREKKKKRASFSDLIELYESERVEKAADENAFALASLTENARVVRAKVKGEDGKIIWKSNPAGITSVQEDSGKDTEQIVTLEGGERRRLKAAKPKYVEKADDRKREARKNLGSRTLSSTAFRKFADKVGADLSIQSIDPEAYGALQDSFESYLLHLFYGANRFAKDDRRVTVLAKDLFNSMKQGEPRAVEGIKNENRVYSNALYGPHAETENNVASLLTDAKIKELAAIADVHRVGSGFIDLARLVADNNGGKAWFRTLCQWSSLKVTGTNSRIIPSSDHVQKTMREKLKWESSKTAASAETAS